ETGHCHFQIKYLETNMAAIRKALRTHEPNDQTSDVWSRWLRTPACPRVAVLTDGGRRTGSMSCIKIAEEPRPDDRTQHRIEPRRQVVQRLIHHCSNSAQLVICSNTRFGRNVAVHIGLLLVDSTHAEETFRTFRP